MRKITYIFISVALFVFSSCGNETAEGLAERIVPAYARNIKFKTLQSADGKDYFELFMRGDRLIIKGNNAGSMAVGLNYYLKNYCNATVSWYDFNPVSVPQEMPAVEKKERHSAICSDRFFLNYCTFGYTFCYWTWKEWERFIDWMALNGVNMPLAITGQEAVWLDVWKQMGMQEADVLDYFTGPAHLPWQRMGNIDKFDGPLTIEWIESQAELQKKIVERERSFGMRPVLGAFAGHVPEQIALKDRYYTCNWLESDKYKTYFIYPSEDIFGEIQKRYLETQEKLFGTDHVYAADLFNEMAPPSWEPDSLASISSRMYESIDDVDPGAEWIQMGWMFLSSQDMWTKERIQAYLDACPSGKVKILDYRGECNEAWERTENFFGAPFIWCYLGNFGGNHNIEGSPGDIQSRIAKVMAQAENCSGIGCVPEGLDVNQEIYEYVFENAWSFVKPVEDWVTLVADTHFGGVSDSFRDAWKSMADSVLFTYSNTRGTLVNLRPYLFKPSIWTGDSDYFYDNVTLYRIWGKMLEDTSGSELYKFDVINVARQVMGNLFKDLKNDYIYAASIRDYDQMHKLRGMMMELLDDLDLLLSSRPEFSLEKWISDARRWGASDGRADEYEKNVRHLLTVWYDCGFETLDDYANRNYSGLTRTYYKTRWEMFCDEIERTVAVGKRFDQDSFDKKMWDAGISWCDSVGLDELEQTSNISPAQLSLMMYDKYGRFIKQMDKCNLKNAFAQTEYYSYANSVLTRRPKVVLFGDSITENWYTLDEKFFDENNFAGRGISGQTSAQLLSRFRSDVVNLHPEYVAILVGINDFAMNRGEIPAKDILDNVISMCELAKVNGIKPMLCSLVPCRKIGWLPQRNNIAEEVIAYNSQLKDYAVRNGIAYVDYHTPMADLDGGLKPQYNYDEVHVTVPAYRKMEEIFLKKLSELD